MALLAPLAFDRQLAPVAVGWQDADQGPDRDRQGGASGWILTLGAVGANRALDRSPPPWNLWDATQSGRWFMRKDVARDPVWRAAMPRRCHSREDLQKALSRASGGVIFTTIQKFAPEKGAAYPLLTDRRNVVVIADEAHRSQYGFKARIELPDDEKPKVDAEIEELTEDETVSEQERLKRKWSTVEALVGADKRLRMVAEDLVALFEDRVQAMDGKAMAVCMSRRICIDLYNHIVSLRPDWHSDDDNAGVIKIVMTGSAAGVCQNWLEMAV